MIRRGPGRLLRAAGVAITALLMTPGFASVAATPTPSSTVAAPADEDVLPIHVAIATIQPQILVPGADLAVGAVLTNTTTETITDAVVNLALSTEDLGNRYRFHMWADAAPTDAAFVGTTKVSIPLTDPLAPGEIRLVDLLLPADQVGLRSTLTQWGPHPLAIEVTGPTGRLGIARTFALWAPPEVAVRPTQFSVIVPIAEDAAYLSDPLAGLLPADPAAPTVTATDQLVTATSPGSRLANLAAIADSAPVTVAVDPRLVSAASEAGGPAASWANQVISLMSDHDGFPLLARGPDLATAIHSESTSLLAGERARATAAWTTLTGSAPATVVAWPAFGLQDRNVAAWLASDGYSALLAGPTELTPASTLTYTPTGLADLAATPTTSAPVLVPENVVTTLLTTPTEPTPVMAAQRLLAELMSITEERPNDSRHIVATLPWLWDPEPDFATAQLSALTAASWVDLQPLSTLLERDAPSIDRSPLPEEHVAPAELTRADIDSLHSDQSRFAAFAQITDTPDLFSAPVDDTVTVLLSSAARAENEARDTVRANLSNAIDVTVTGVTTLPGSEIRVGGSDVRLPVVVTNMLTVPVTVDVRLSGASALRVPDTVEVTVGPGDTVTTWVPVTAIANGPAVVKVDLLGPDGTTVATGADLEVNVRAEWDTWATMLMAIGLTALVIFGVIRTIRRRSGTRAEQMAAEGVGG